MQRSFHQVRRATIATTIYSYNPETFRRTAPTTTRPTFPAARQTAQALTYVYDPGGRIMHIADSSQQTIFFNSRNAKPGADYTDDDAVYGLIEVLGREQLGQAAAGSIAAPWPTSYNDAPWIGLPHPGDGNAMSTYGETYSHDDAGNLLKLVTSAATPPIPAGHAPISMVSRACWKRAGWTTSSPARLWAAAPLGTNPAPMMGTATRCRCSRRCD